MTTPDLTSITDPPLPADDRLAIALLRSAHEAALRPERDWVKLYQEVLANHPDPWVRVCLATGAPLSLLRLLAVDPCIEVRLAAVVNPLAADGGVAATLATDPIARVAVAYLDRYDVSREVAQAIADHGQPEAQLRLLAKPLPIELVECLAGVLDEQVARVAIARLAHRRARLAATPGATTRPEFVAIAGDNHRGRGGDSSYESDTARQLRRPAA